MAKFATRYNPPVSSGLNCPEGSSLTRQEFAAEADINNLVRRYQETGSFYDPLVSASRQPQFGDFTSVGDYMDACNKLISAQQSFDSLPAAVRDRFSNDPAQLIAFLGDSNNRDEAVRLGLLPPPSAVDTKPDEQEK